MSFVNINLADTELAKLDARLAPLLKDVHHFFPSGPQHAQWGSPRQNPTFAFSPLNYTANNLHDKMRKAGVAARNLENELALICSEIRNPLPTVEEYRRNYELFEVNRQNIFLLKPIFRDLREVPTPSGLAAIMGALRDAMHFINTVVPRIDLAPIRAPKGSYLHAMKQIGKTVYAGHTELPPFDQGDRVSMMLCIVKLADELDRQQKRKSPGAAAKKANKEKK